MNQSIGGGIAGGMNLNEVLSRMGHMSPQQLQQVATMHSDDPLIVSTAKYYADAYKKQQTSAQSQPGMPPPVNQQAIADMAPPVAQGLPENSGIGALPAPNMQKMAGGGIVAFDDGGEVEEPVQMFAGGGLGRGDAGEGQSDPLEVALGAERVTDPAQVAYLRALYSQESSSGKDTRTSKSGAVGPMQVMPDTFKGVNPKGDLDAANKYDQARAGVRYALQGLQAANNDPALAATYYYGGPKGLTAARQGIAFPDRLNPKAPNTIEYGQSVADKTAAYLEQNPAAAIAQPEQQVVTQADVDAKQQARARAAAWGPRHLPVGDTPPRPRPPDFTRMDQPVSVHRPATGAGAGQGTRGIAALLPETAPAGAGEAPQQYYSGPHPSGRTPANFTAASDAPAEVAQSPEDLSPQEKASKGFSLSNRDLFMMGMAGLQSKSPNFLGTVGDMLPGFEQSQRLTSAGSRAAYEKQLGDLAAAREDRLYNTPDPTVAADKKAAVQLLKAKLASATSRLNAAKDAGIMDPELLTKLNTERDAVQQQIDALLVGTGAIEGGKVAAAPSTAPSPGFSVARPKVPSAG